MRIVCVLCLLCLPLLTGCVSLLPEVPPAKRLLLNPTFQQLEGPRVSWSLIVERPVADALLDSQRIKIIAADDESHIHTVDVIAGIEWSDALPRVLQQHMITALERSNRIQAVGQGDEGFAAPLTLQMSLKNFEVMLSDGAPTIVIETSAKLIASPGKEVVTQKTFHHETQAKAKSLQAFSSAFDQALSVHLQEIAQWSLDYKM